MHQFRPNYDLYELDWVPLPTLQKINVVFVKEEKKMNLMKLELAR